MENDESITLLSRTRGISERSSTVFSLLIHRGPNAVTYAAPPDGDAYVGCKTICMCPLPMASTSLNQGNFGSIKEIYTHSLVGKHMKCSMASVCVCPTSSHWYHAVFLANCYVISSLKKGGFTASTSPTLELFVI